MKCEFLSIRALLILLCSISLYVDVSGQHSTKNTKTGVFSSINVNEILRPSSLQPDNVSQSIGSAEVNNRNSTGLKKLLDSQQSRATLLQLHQIASSQRMMDDTLIVGFLPGDTLRVTGVWANNGPIIVLQDGVLIFDHANATILGDLFVIGRGQVWVDSSTLFFPQQYFYQRSILVVDTTVLNIQNSTLDYGGMSHNFIAYGHAQVTLNNVHQADWTTAGIYDHANFFCDGNNLGGEYICTGNSTVHFRNTSTLLVWHHLPDSAVIQHQFPTGPTIPAYTFNNQQPGIQGVGYTVQLDSCSDVMWAIMPENGSDVTLSNSTIRAIGLWFNRGDSVSISGLVNNSNYSNFIAPLADRNLNLINTQLQTWSVYLFDSSQATISGCILGEVGAMGTSRITTNGFYCDGSGGYFWSSESGITFASNVSVATSVRSEKNGIMVFGYGSVNSGGAAAVGQSLLVVVQSSLPSDPVANDGATVWFLQVDAPVNAYIDSTVLLPGSTWIDQGPQGSFMHFNKYGMYYQIPNAGSWTPIDTGIANEVRHGILASWNTHGLTPGSYYVRLLSFNDLGDSIEAIRQVTLLPTILGVNAMNQTKFISVYPNPTSGSIQVNFELVKEATISLELSDLSGKILKKTEEIYLSSGNQSIVMDTQGLVSGMYFLLIRKQSGTQVERIHIIN